MADDTPPQQTDKSGCFFGPCSNSLINDLYDAHYEKPKDRVNQGTSKNLKRTCCVDKSAFD